MQRKIKSLFLIFWSAITIKWSTLSRAREGSVSKKHNSNWHHGAFGDTGWKGPDSAGKQQHGEVIPYVGNVQIKQNKLCYECSPQHYEDIWSIENNQWGLLVIFLLCHILLEVSYVSFSDLLWKCLVSVHYKGRRLLKLRMFMFVL